MRRVGDGIDVARHGQHERAARRAGDPRRWSVQCHTSLIRAGSEGFRPVYASDGVEGEEGGGGWRPLGVVRCTAWSTGAGETCSSRPKSWTGSSSLRVTTRLVERLLFL